MALPELVLRDLTSCAMRCLLRLLIIPYAKLPPMCFCICTISTWLSIWTSRLARCPRRSIVALAALTLFSQPWCLTLCLRSLSWRWFPACWALSADWHLLALAWAVWASMLSTLWVWRSGAHGIVSTWIRRRTRLETRQSTRSSTTKLSSTLITRSTRLAATMKCWKVRDCQLKDQFQLGDA